MDNPLKVYSGSTLLYTTPINTGCRRKVQLMTEDSITVKFSDKNRIKFPVGARIGDFFMTEEQQGKFNAVTGGYDYELKFNAYYWLWANRLLYYVMPGVENAPKETSFKLTATIDVHAAIILRALTALGFTYNGSSFGAETDEDFSTEAKYISYANMSVLGGIQAIAEAYECEWWVAGNIIHFGKCNAGGEYDFIAGDNVSAITPSVNNKQANRLIVFGSDRNLPPNYRSVGDSDITDAVVQRRLMLPAGTPWLQTAENIPDDEIVEEEVVFDSVYPRTLLTVSDVIQYEKQNEDGKTQTFYRIKYGDSFKFSNNYKLPDTDEFHIVFESGDLNGMDFTVIFNPLGVGEKLDDGSWNPDAQMFEIIVNEDYGRELPDTVLHPAKTDRFAIHGWDATKMESLGLVAAAEQELLAEGQKEIEERRKDLTTYICPMMWDWCKAQIAKHDMPKLGSVVNLHFTAGDAGRRSRVIGFEHDLDIEYSNVTYTCGEKVSASRLKTLESKVEGLTHDGAAAKVQNCLDFLSKRYSDRTPHALNVGGKLTAEAGAQFSPSFAEGFTGFGARVSPDGHGEMESLTLRRFLEVPEIRKNRITVTGGIIWNTPAAGIVEHCDPSPADSSAGSFRLKLEQDEIGEFAAGDIVMGVWQFFESGSRGHNLTQGDIDAIPATTADGTANSDREFATVGFCTIYLTVTSVSGDHNEIVSYRLRTGHLGGGKTPAHPHEAMHLVTYGSVSDTSRQTSLYITRGYLRFLRQVNQYQFGPGNIAAQFGDLSGLNVGGTSMSEYSAFLRNIYMTGNIYAVFAPVLDIRLSLGAITLSRGQTTVLKAALTRDGREDAALTATGWAISRDTGDSAADAAWNTAHSSYGGADLTLGYGDLNGRTSAVFTVSAKVKAERMVDGQTKTYEEQCVSLATLYAVPTSATYRGEWESGSNYFQGNPGEELSQVSRNGVKWECLVTHVSDDTNAPGFGSAYWRAVEGDLDPHVGFEEDVVTVIKGRIDETLTAVVTMYGEDISDNAAVSYSWTRRSWNLTIRATANTPAAFAERTASDKVWNQKGRTGRTLRFTDTDMDWDSTGGPAKVQFTVTATVTEPGKAARMARATVMM